MRRRGEGSIAVWRISKKSSKIMKKSSRVGRTGMGIKPNQSIKWSNDVGIRNLPA